MKNATIAAVISAALVFAARADSRSDDMVRRVEEMRQLREAARAVPPGTPVTNSAGTVMTVHTNGSVTVSSALPGGVDGKKAGVTLTTRSSLRRVPKK